MLKSARSGKVVEEDDIPPPVHVSPAKHASAPTTEPSKPLSPPPVKEPKQSGKNVIGD